MRRVFSLLLLAALAAVAVHAAAPHGLVPHEGAARAPPAAGVAAQPAASVKDLMERPMSEDAARVEKQPIHGTTAAAATTPHSLADWFKKRTERHSSKAKPQHHEKAQPKHRYGHHGKRGHKEHAAHGKHCIGKLRGKKERKVEPAPATPTSIDSKQSQQEQKPAAARSESEIKLQSALDRIVARVRRIFQTERDQVQRAAKDLAEINKKIEQERADKAKADAMQKEAEAAKARASVSVPNAAAAKREAKSEPAKFEPVKTVPRPMHVLLTDVNSPPPTAVALSLTDIISQCGSHA